MNFEINNRIKMLNKYSNLDALYGPYNSVEDACAAIPEELRGQGLTIGVINTRGEVEEYWWKKNIQDIPVRKIEDQNLTMDYINGKSVYSFSEGEDQIIEFTVTGGLPAKEAIIYREGREIKRQSVIKGGINQVILNETELGTQHEYYIQVIDSLGGLATVAGTDETKLVYTVQYGKVDIKWILTDIEGIINTEATGKTIPFEVYISDDSKPYNMVLSIEGDDGEGQIYYEDPDGNVHEGSTITIDNIYGNLINQQFVINGFPHGQNILSIAVSYDGEQFVQQYQFDVLYKNEFNIHIRPFQTSHNNEEKFSIPFIVTSGTQLGYSIIAKAGQQVLNTIYVAANKEAAITVGPITTAGTYDITLTANSGSSSQSESVVVTITEASKDFSPIDTVPVGEFINPGYPGKIIDGTWINSGSNSNVTMEVSNTSIYEDESGMSLSFGEQSQGQLSIPQYIKDSSSNGDYTIELYYKANYIGRNAKVAYFDPTRKFWNTNLDITPESITTTTGTYSLQSDLPTDKWVHIAIVYKQQPNTSSKLEDNYDRPFSAIYINGVMSKAVAIHQESSQLINEAARLIFNNNDGVYGNLQIKTLRVYDRALLSSEVFKNFLSCIPNDEAIIINNRNKLEVPAMKFKNMNEILKRDTGITKVGKVNLINFFGQDGINSQKDKALQKTTGVFCEITYSGSATPYYGIVSTQGTSTLKYPVKNYKIKLYDVIVEKTETGEDHIISANFNKKVKAVFGDFQPEIDGEQVGESTFTLKCDYMDSSHLNNTPTCMWFNKIIHEFKDSSQQDIITHKSPAAELGYVDAIQGIPCVLDCEEDGEDGTVGTFMLNLDKSADALGFKVTNHCQSFEGKANSNDTSGAFYDRGYTGDELKSYIGQDFEIRYSYDGEEDMIIDDAPNPNFDWGDEDFETGSGILRMWKWVASVPDRETYRSQFSSVFNLEYMILYYIQMIVFGQVDNPGKNCMWDSWDGQIWYPRPYDLDSELGLDNDGFARTTVYAELNARLSMDDETRSNPEEAMSDVNRFCYNTPGSNMWIKFATYYHDEICSFYQKIRKSGYGPAQILGFLKQTVLDKLGEEYYNKDFTTKYLTTKAIQEGDEQDDFVRCAFGTRWDKISNWLNGRFVFCDTYFANGLSDTRLEFRPRGNTSTTIQISTRSPQYIIFRRDADEKYYFCNGSVQIEYAFANDVNYRLDGRIDNVTYIRGINTVKPASFECANMTNLLELDLSGSTQLQELKIGNTPFLQKINLSQTGVTRYVAPMLISEITADNSQLASLTVPEKCAVQKISCKNSKLLGINLVDLPYLASLDISQNTFSYGSDVVLYNLPLISRLIFTDSTFNGNFTIDNINVQSLDLSGLTFTGQVTLQNLNNIKTLNLASSSVQGELDLQELGTLESLDLRSSSIPFIYVKYDSSDLHANKIKYLYLSNSKVDTIGCDGIDSEQGIVDMKAFNDLDSSFRFGGATRIQKIKNFNWNNPANSMFYGCSSLQEIVDSDIKVVNNGTSMFQNCTNLVTIQNVSLTKSCTTMASAFGGCHNIPLSLIRTIINSAGPQSTLQNISSLCLDKNIIETTLDLDSFFQNIKPTNISSMLYNWHATSDLTSITGQLPSSVTNADSAFAANEKLATIPSNIFKKITGPVSLNRTFAETALQYFAGATDSLLPADFLPVGATNLNFLFADTKIVRDLSTISGTNGLFSQLLGLTSVRGIFYNCSTISGAVDGLFTNNGNLTDASQAFKGTKAVVQGGQIFNDNASVMIDGMFAGNDTEDDRAIQIGPDTFKCTLITSAGDDTRESPGNTSDSSRTGLFQGRKIEFSNTTMQDMLNKFSNSTSLRQMFRNSKFNTSISQYPNLTEFIKLTTTAYMFNNCEGLTFPTTNSPLNLPSQITDTSYMFAGSGVVAIDPTSLKNKPRLSSTAYMFYNNPNLVTPMNNLSFTGCYVLSNTSGMFYNSGVEGIVRRNIFSDCKNTLQYVTNMFANSRIQTIEDGYYDGESETVVGGLLSDCFSLINTSGMFSGCHRLCGSVPQYIFYSSTGDKYASLADISYMFAQTSLGRSFEIDDEYYLVHPDTFRALNNVQYMQGLFNSINYTTTDVNKQRIMSGIHPTTFDGQYNVANIQNIFRNTPLNGSIGNIFKNSLDTLTNASYAFAHCGSIVECDEQLFLNYRDSNKKLATVRGLFYNHNFNENSSVPMFSLASKFSKLNTDEVTKASFGPTSKSANLSAPYNEAPWGSSFESTEDGYYGYTPHSAD